MSATLIYIKKTRVSEKKKVKIKENFIFLILTDKKKHFKIIATVYLVTIAYR
jgi:hypothetical protein